MIALRETEQRAKQIEELERLTDLSGPASVIDFALGHTIASLRRQREEKEESK